MATTDPQVVDKDDSTSEVKEGKQTLFLSFTADVLFRQAVLP